ncbi:winged helix-turn-helix transcriptional regulator [Gemella morbillorum]|jgi:HTH-type transcriptional activator hxlR|uniref:winged helix-turn-helix transcriptional regulator n=1 Tax=Gemella morbillorum TaxID=29391 RepID=UPI001CB0395D|nr:helix-turn-helix domain-containing protein [Gemella morbillorum]MBF1208956.1 helix-turn-helix transcriptional regulator [Gemella morbillorum]MDK8240145.1 helix-turn-helix domain-containing protein [Gemella morbillorum]MDK8254634.1 helix-turn-helix domain-containing protein [Gemella morbillorum]
MPNKKLPSNLPACPVEVTLLLLSNKWTILILRDLFTGTKRFGELKKSLNGVSQKVLTANLRSLEEKGIIEREVFPEVPPRVEYRLTDLGKTLDPIIKSMHDWGEFYKSIF